MARRVSLGLIVWALIGCDGAVAPLRIEPPEMGFPDAAPVDSGDSRDSDAGGPDAALAGRVTIDTNAIDACDAPTVAIDLVGDRPARVIPIVDGDPRPPIAWTPGAPLMLNLQGLSEGPHATAFEVDGERIDGPLILIDTRAPQVEWPVDADVCVAEPPTPTVTDVSPVDVVIEDAAAGCRLTRVARVTDACGFETSARSTWRVGPPGPPLVEGERVFTWASSDVCTGEISAEIGRAGEPLQPYDEAAIIEWPGDYRLVLTASGCNGPDVHEFMVQVPAGVCDRPTRPLDTAPNVRGWLEISSQRLVDLSLDLAGRDLRDASIAMREAATLLARHPGFPGGCPGRDECLIGADWQRILDALSRSGAALADVPDTRAARRCVAEAARAVVAASAYAPDLCQAPRFAQALVDAWDDDDARREALCLCAGSCAPDAECADAPVLEDAPDPVDFHQQIVELAGPDVLACLDDPGCPALPDLIERTRAAINAGECRARSLLSVAWLVIGRHCAGVGRFRHPGTDALAAAVGRWPLGQAGSAATLAHLEVAIAACLPDR